MFLLARRQLWNRERRESGIRLFRILRLYKGARVGRQAQMIPTVSSTVLVAENVSNIEEHGRAGRARRILEVRTYSQMTAYIVR